MLKKLKKFIKANKLLRSLIIPFFNKKIQFGIFKLCKMPFSYKLLNGHKIKFYPKGQIARHIYSKSFEKQETYLFQKIIKHGMNVIDAGANIGLYSLIASQLVGQKGEILSFEPSKETFLRLLNNIKLNNSQNIIPLNIGLGNKINETLILRQDAGYGDAERYLFPNNKAPNCKLENINTPLLEEKILINTIDDCLKKLKIQKIDFLKMDTEGFEYYILNGAKNMLKTNPEIIIMMECTNLGTTRASTTQEEIFKLLKYFGLNIFYWNKNLNTWRDDKIGVLKVGNIWVCKNIDQLPNFI